MCKILLETCISFLHTLNGKKYCGARRKVKVKNKKKKKSEGKCNHPGYPS